MKDTETKRKILLFLGTNLALVLTLTPPLTNAQVATLTPAKEPWSFEEGVDNRGKKPIYVQILTLQVKNLDEFLQRQASAPRLALVCRGEESTKGRPGYRLEGWYLMIYHAGIFQTFPHGSIEQSDVEYRFEIDDTTATSFLREEWFKSPLKDEISQSQPENFIRLMFLSRTVLVKLNLVGTSAPIAQFDIRGLREQIPKMSVCSKELNKLALSHH